ncbi:prolactin-releasing peptide receptor [Anopheles ziemanni]|uniref:prolactin-releasing peptide receptor n=1 Tax=Anopheles coustani TaxID=139045 RepID=UPI002659B0A7|nr:prolactin-releasing peptide receptor [Anopheles coustani]XP_058170736.1 prolactin-releasing peptide receptor [Anopheles ziemanni]
MASVVLGFVEPSGLPMAPRASTTAFPPISGHANTSLTNFTLDEPVLLGWVNSSTVAPPVGADIMSNKLLQIVFCVLYSSIFVLGVFGNVLVCYVVFRNKAMQTVTNLFITNLALSDILLCVLAVPFTPSYTFLRRWVFGKLLCHTVPLAQGCSVYISTLTLTSIAIDRFFVIIYPFHPRMKLSTCITIIVLIWSFAIMVTMPYGLYMKLHGVAFNATDSPQGTLPSAMYCEELWPSEEMRKTFSIVTSILQFVLPFIIMAFCYVCVSIRLNDRARTKPGSKTSRREEADRDRKKRTNRMLISMVAIFGISWLPLNVVNMCNDFYSDINGWRFYNLIFFIAHLTAMSSTCYNPFLYAWLNDNFRKEFKQVLPCFDPSRGRAGTVNGNRGGGGGWRSERTCNGNNDTVQETLIASSQALPSGRSSQQPSQQHASSGSSQTHHQPTVDSILLSEVGPPLPLPPPINSNVLPSVQSAETVVLPSGVLETPFDVQLVPGVRNGTKVEGATTLAATSAASVGNGALNHGSSNSKLSSLILINDGTTPDSKVPAIL